MQSLLRGPGGSSLWTMPPRLLVGPRAQRADLARRRAQRPQRRGRQLTLNQLAHAQRLEWPNAAKPMSRILSNRGQQMDLALLWGLEDRLGPEVASSAAATTTTFDHAAARARKESDDRDQAGGEPGGSRCPARAPRRRGRRRFGLQPRAASKRLKFGSLLHALKFGKVGSDRSSEAVTVRRLSR